MSDDPFDVATTTFINPEDLVGRLVLVIPTDSGQAKGDDGNMYTYITGDMLVLDGEPSDKMPGPFPYRVDGQRFSAGMMVNQLKPKLPTKRMLVGRVDSRPGKFKKLAFSFGEPTEADVAAARPIATQWLDERAAAIDPFS